MDDKQLALLLTAMSDQTTAFNRMADAMTGILVHLDPKQAAKFAAPGYKRRLAEYANFDWESIGATVIAFDRHGATEVEYDGASFRRYRSNDDDPKGVDIRFNRVVSGTVDGKDMVWASLIKFADKKPKDPPRPLRGELAETITAAQQQKQTAAPVAVAIAPTKQINNKSSVVPVAPTKEERAAQMDKAPETDAEKAATKILAWSAVYGETMSLLDAQRMNARAVAYATGGKLPQSFIDGHTIPGDVTNVKEIVDHSRALLHAFVTGKVPEPVF